MKRPTRGPSCWRQWYIDGAYDKHEFTSWLREAAPEYGPEYGFREDEVAVATNLPLTFVRKHASGNWRMPSDFTYLTYDEVVDLFDG